MEDDGSGPVNASDVDDLGTVQIHGVNTAVGRIGPVNLFMSPIVSDAFRINRSRFNQSGVGGRREIGMEPSDPGIRSDLRVNQTAIGVVEI